MSIKEKIKFCGTTSIPEGSRVKINDGFKETIGKHGTAYSPYGLYENAKGYISVKLDEKMYFGTHIHVKASEVEIIK